ncbi:hypothetical protein OsJ_23985 [Oryza sativa Japonica Group]|uniref:Thaumatin-like protein n=1 Tax=Oryza sativa subsp. japonica TaxID=39947 RepID=B9FWV6_ORYSJ|nr:hypothetical protein OsJ_23985 [Oryza sativa Japonica Group]
MAMGDFLPASTAAAFFVLLLGVNGAAAVNFTFHFHNNCPETVWPAALSSAGRPPFPTTGFALPPGASLSVAGVTATWSGRVWGRHRCATGGGRFSCESGDCRDGAGRVQRRRRGAAGHPRRVHPRRRRIRRRALSDFYEVSNVKGLNLPVQVRPDLLERRQEGATAALCRTTACPADINRVCPSELAVRAADRGGAAAAAVVACKSACLAFGTDEQCCRGRFASPDKCAPSEYSRLFKAQCPQAYSYAFDDRSSTFTCANATGYRITFAPPPPPKTN